jgi:DNA-binding transcriptional regulator YdaS (Cro superfamily)
LALALDVSGLLHFAPQTSQQERIKELVQKLGVEVAHLDQTLNQLMNRKAGPVKAIERMKAALVARQEVRDGR